MKLLDKIKTVPSSTPVILLKLDEETEILNASAKWIRKKGTDYHDYEVKKTSTDDYGRLVIVLKLGKTKAQEKRDHKKFLKEHNGKTEEQVAKEKWRDLQLRMALMTTMCASSAYSVNDD